MLPHILAMQKLKLIHSLNTKNGVLQFFISGNKALILVTKLSSSVTGGGTLLLGVC